MSGVFNILQLIAVAICFVIIDKVGRRPLATFGAIGNTICYVIITILAGLYSHDWPAHQGAGWATVAMAFCFILVYGVSYSPLGWAMPSEVFSTPTRSKGMALSVCVNGLSNFIVAIAIPPMMANRGYQTYIFFTVMCLLATVWAVLLVPDTKGKTLEEMDEVFGDVQGQQEQAIMRQAMVSVNQETLGQPGDCLSRKTAASFEMPSLDLALGGQQVAWFILVIQVRKESLRHHLPYSYMCRV